jgi:hypothetical protein
VVVLVLNSLAHQQSEDDDEDDTVSGHSHVFQPVNDEDEHEHEHDWGASPYLSIPARSMKAVISARPKPSLRLHITNGRSPRIFLASFSMTSREAPT